MYFNTINDFCQVRLTRLLSIGMHIYLDTIKLDYKYSTAGTIEREYYSALPYIYYVLFSFY